MIIPKIEVHFVISIALDSTRAARPCEKGANAEGCAVAGTHLAARIRSVLLSQKCGALSSMQTHCVVLEDSLFGYLFSLQKGIFI